MASTLLYAVLKDFREKTTDAIMHTLAPLAHMEDALPRTCEDLTESRSIVVCMIDRVCL